LLPGNVTAQIQDLSRRNVADAGLSGDNRFEFRAVPNGDYWLVVADGKGGTLSESTISITSGTRIMELRLTVPKQERPPSGNVSVAELQNPPSREAIRAAAEAQKQTAAGHYDKAVELLEKAIALSPDYAIAYTNLTAAYVRVRKLDEAIATAQRAVDLSGSKGHGKPNAIDLSNLAYAQLLKGHCAEAIANSRRALEIAPESDKAHLVLGSALAGAGDLHQAEPHLELAAKTIPSAQPILEAVRRKLALASAIPATQSAQR